MSDFIQAFTENQEQLSNRTSYYGQNLTANTASSGAVVMDLNGSWRGPGYIAAAGIGDDFQAGVRPHEARAEGRAAGVKTVANHYGTQIGNEVHINSSVGPLLA